MKTPFAALFLLCCSSWLSAQTRTDTIVTNFNLLEQIPQEKLYLHLDKPYYGAGENIWMKGYLVNVLQPCPINISHYMEKGQTIGGHIKGFFGSNIKKGAISIVAPRLPGVTIQNSNEIHIRNNTQAALIVINDVAYQNDADMLKDIPSSDIENLSMLRDNDAIIFGSQGAGGAIVVQLKEGKNMPASAPPGILLYTPLGYCDNVEFYCPAYYTPDSHSPEEIVIEGIDKKGKACRITKTINGL
ncbi:MAG: Plug domain-containing protein [Mediterranea sp.]|jgi:hypothetical protein|nr:Plug domain-containing protein [Mediterranea sp.]